MIFLSLILCLCLSVSAYAADPVCFSQGRGSIPMYSGVSNQYNVAQMLKNAGVSYVRDEYNWQRLKKIKVSLS